jgi:ribosomal protein L13
MELLHPTTVNQYQYEERTLMKRRYYIAQKRIKRLLNSMVKDTLSTKEKRRSLIKDLNAYHNTTKFSRLNSMGRILRLHMTLMLGKPKPKLERKKKK